MSVKLAAIVQPERQIADGGFGGELEGAMSVPLPPELEGKKDVNIVETMDTNPTVEFVDVGDYMLGRYAGYREFQIEKRMQKMYDLKTPSGVVVSVWGSKILDGRMADAIKKGLQINS